MAFCEKCGTEKEFENGRCEKCGFQPAAKVTGGSIDDGGFLWGLLGFCVPVVGLVLYLIWKNEKPLTAKAAGLGALISTGLGVIFYIIGFIGIGLGM